MPKVRFPVFVAALVGALALLAVGAGSAAAASSSSHKTPCWRLVLNEEYSGRISGTYEVHCYREAIKHLSGDALIYGSFKNDITRAMLSAMATLRAKGVKIGPHTKLPGETGSRGLQSHKHKKGFFAAIADKIGPGNASSIPLPLLILAGLGLLLIAAAGASFAARWISARRAQPSPATSPPTPPRK